MGEKKCFVCRKKIEGNSTQLDGKELCSGDCLKDYKKGKKMVSEMEKKCECC